MPRPDQRASDQLRPIKFQPDIAPHATGSVLVSFGNTQVICAATIQEEVPRWMKVQGVPGGWLTAEYSMLPYSTLGRKDRDINKGKLDGRSQEIQRLIGRSLRAIIDLKKLGARTVWIDCDVLQADGGTRTAAITGAYVALAMAINRLMATGVLREQPLTKKVAAISAGICEGTALLDLCYTEDRDAEVDCNLVMTEDGQFVEIQSSGEEATFSESQMNALLSLGKKGIAELCRRQQKVLEEVGAAKPLKATSSVDLASLEKAFKKL